MSEINEEKYSNPLIDKIDEFFKNATDADLCKALKDAGHRECIDCKHTNLECKEKPKVNKLYKIDLIFQAVVVAKDEMEAERIASEFRYEICNDTLDPDFGYPERIDSVSDLEFGWDEKCIPYGLDDGEERTIGEYLRKSQ